jgi:hypothetical protein
VQEAEGAAAAVDRTRILRFPVGKQEAPLALRFVHHRRGIFSALPYVLHPRMPSLGGGRQTCAAPCPRRFHGCRCRGLTSLTAHRPSLKMSDGVGQACPQTGARDGQERRSALPVPRRMPP